ncbi:MAG: hypothetical protein M5U14_10740 [Acidimicrobiia bacterium]|nr:hypothetical protein [Acidimicrobiia bacterium]
MVVESPAGGSRTDLGTVFVPAVLARSEEGLACAIALQCSPTKESVTRLRIGRSARLRRALAWTEGEAAAAWALDRWPGLGAPLRQFLPIEASRLRLLGLDDPEELLEAALARGHGCTEDVPWLFGTLPAIVLGRPNGSKVRRIEARLPWSTKQPARQSMIHSVPLSGDQGGDRADAAMSSDPDEAALDERAVGLPYDEWDHRRGSHRRNWVRVLEVPARHTTTLASMATSRVVELPPYPTRHRVGRQAEGSDLDVDAYLEAVTDVRMGREQDWQVFAEMARVRSDLAVAFLVDASASLGVRSGEPFRAQARIVSLLGELLAAEGHPWAVYAFRSFSRERVEVRVLKGFDDRRTQPTFEGLRPCGSTRLGAAIRHATHRLVETHASRHVLLSLGDAGPYDEGYEGRYAIADAAHAATEARERGAFVFHLSVAGRTSATADEIFGARHNVRVRRSADLRGGLARIFRQLEDHD